MVTLVQKFNDNVSDQIRGYPLTLVISKIMSLAADAIQEAYQLGVSANAADTLPCGHALNTQIINGDECAECGAKVPLI